MLAAIGVGNASGVENKTAIGSRIEGISFGSMNISTQRRPTVSKGTAPMNPVQAQSLASWYRSGR